MLFRTKSHWFFAHLAEGVLLEANLGILCHLADGDQFTLRGGICGCTTNAALGHRKSARQTAFADIFIPANTCLSSENHTGHQRYDCPSSNDYHHAKRCAAAHYGVKLCGCLAGWVGKMPRPMLTLLRTKIFLLSSK
jgi:hypothetical protein